MTACAKYSCGATTGPLARLTKGDARRQPRRLHRLRPRPIGHRVPATRHAPHVHPFGPVSSSAEAMLVLCAGALAQARARAQGSCAPPPARGQQPRLRRTAGPDAAHAHRQFRAAGPRASFVTPVCKNLQGCRGHWLARAARAQGCRARALACARARAQGGTHVGGTRASARARAHPCAS